ncbi:VWA domain-containing protein [Bacillus testis]|uniref:VWA domain-containing protein n=1 Tax=Bacillus testis TaxID=1622072 RepID=UPI0011C80CD9|nr:VWA domain-containing protein [Bacillus testis]
MKKEIQDLPPLREDASKKDFSDYLKYVYSLVSTDFDDPQDLLNKWQFSMSGHPQLSNGRYQFKKNYNVEIILDSSGSMANKIGGVSRMDLAKQAIKDFLADVPKEAKVSLRVYGHKGTGSEKDKSKSCASVEQVYGFESYEEKKLNQALNQFTPSGWTPIADALQQSQQSFQSFDAKTNTNLIYLVSDGIETCDGDPVAVAKTFVDSNVSPIINVIGFDADQKAQQQLKEIANKANGIYTTVNNGEQLKAKFDRAQEVLEEWDRWKKDALSDADAKRVDNSFEILEFTNDWSMKKTRQKLNISYVLNIMKNEGKLTLKQRDYIKDICKPISELADEARNQIEADLKKVNVENTEALKEEINNKYHTSVDG